MPGVISLAYEQGSASLMFEPDGIICVLTFRRIVSSKTEAKHIMARKRVFVAEDSLLILMALETILDQAEIELAGTAASLAEALKLAETCDADVAILDVNLGDGMCFPAADILMARGIPT